MEDLEVCCHIGDSSCSNNWTVFIWKLMEKVVIIEKKVEQYSEYQEWLSLFPKMPIHYNHIA